MPEDVLEKVNSVLGRKVEPVAKPATAQPSAQGLQVEKILGRSIQPVKLPDMAASRFGLYSKARGNGFDQKKAVGVAMSQAGTMGAAAAPTTWDKFKGTLSKIPVNYGRTSGDVGQDLSRIGQRANNPFLMTDDEWAKEQQAHTEFFERHMGKGFAAGASQGAMEFGEEFASPVQVALALGTFGESALARAAAKLGVKGAVPAARTMAKLLQAQFTAQMVEGAATGAEQTYKSATEGDWEAAGKAFVGMAASGLMAKGIISHEDAVGRVRQDLEKVAREKYGVPEGKGMTAVFTNRFDQLDPYRQGEVIDEAIKRSPEYQAVLQQATAQDQKARERTKTQQQGRLQNYYGTAMQQAWNPNIAQRTIRRLGETRERGRKLDIKKAIEDHNARQVEITRQLIEEQKEQERQSGRVARGEKRKEAAGQRSELSDKAKSIATTREGLNAEREKGNEPPVQGALPERHVDATVDENGQVTYPADYWGEQSNFGVAAGESGHSIYRQTPRGIEWMDSEGNFSPDPESLFQSHDPETADTVARIASLSATADTAAEGSESTPEKAHEADVLAGIRRDLVAGQIGARDAQRKAGIAEKVKLADHHDAAREGKLTGPYHESSPAEFYSQLETEARNAGMSDEDVQEVVSGSGALARDQVEGNLNHVYRPGDYVVSKRGVKWTLDSKGMLHPNDGGGPIPLMKGGLYSNQAFQLAASGRVGYGTHTREQRRADNAKRAEVQKGIRGRQEEVDREMRLSYQNVGLENAEGSAERGDEGDKAERRQKFLSRPPVAPEVQQARNQRRMAYKASNDPDSVINHLAKQYGATPDEVMRIALAGREPETVEAQVANLEAGDRISDDFRKDRPWMVEQDKGGNLWLRSGQARIALDRLNPSERVHQIVERGTITRDSHEWTEEEKHTAAFEKAYKVHQKFLVEGVRERMEGKKVDPEPKSPEQAQEQAKAADQRANAAESVATEATIDAINPTTDNPEKAVEDVKKAEEHVKVAEEAAAQAAEAAAKTVPPDPFPQRAPASIGYKGSSGTIVQNNREFQFHYELLPIEGVQTSHSWNGVRMLVNPEFPEPLQPRTISDDEAKQNDQRATLDNYDFRQYSDKTINASMGPTIVDEGARSVGGNTRLAILRRHLEYIDAIRDPEEKSARMAGFKAAMRQLAQESGIAGYPDDDRVYVVVRMLDRPIETVREAAELGRLFNKSVGVQIGKAAKGVSFSKSFTEPLLEEIGRRVESADGVIPAMNADPEFFRQVVISKFGIVPEEYADWFETKTYGYGDNERKVQVLHKNGQDQFVKALLGTVVKDTAILNRIEGKTAYRALERGLQYVLKMRALPDLDISEKVLEAVAASADTQGTDPEKHSTKDPWRATYRQEQEQLAGMEVEAPPEPDRVVETLWRALHASDAAVPRTFNDRLKSFIADESRQDSMFGPAEPEKPVEAFNRAFKKELRETALARGDKREELTEEEFNAALRNREFSDEERQEVEDLKTKAEQKPEPVVEPAPVKASGGLPPPPKFETVSAHETTPEEYAQYRKNLAARGITPENAGEKWGEHIAEEEAGMLASKRDEPEPQKSGLAGPPKAKTAEKKLADDKAAQGYVTPNQLLDFLQHHPGTQDHAHELMRTAKMMAEFVFDDDRPEGVDRKDALSWILKDRVARIEEGQSKTKRGEYNDPMVERGIGSSILRLHKAADPTTFIHEFAHVIFPFLSNAHIKDIDTIGGMGYSVWDGKAGSLRGETYAKLSEKLAHGLEKFLRDENPAGFTSEVKALLGKLKSVIRKVYLAFRNDPLSEYENTDRSRAMFSKMFHISEFDLADTWREEVKKARKAEKSLPKPEEAPHPLVKLAREAGGKGIQESMAGHIEDEAGERVDPKKPTAVITYDSLEDAVSGLGKMLGDKVQGAEVIRAEDGQFGVRFNIDKKLPSELNQKFGDQAPLYQGLPESDRFSPDDPLTREERSEKFRSDVAENEKRTQEQLEPYRAAERQAREELGENATPEAVANRVWQLAGVDNPLDKLYGYNRKSRPGQGTLFQGLPEKHPGLRLEELEHRLKTMPSYMMAQRKLLELQVRNLKNEIRSSHGVEERQSESSPEIAKAALKEIKNGAERTERNGERPNGVPGLPQPPRVGGIPKPPKLGMPNNAAAKRGVRPPTSLTNVTPVSLEPLSSDRGTPAGTVKGEAFDEKAWREGLKRSGLPETAPPPTVSLSRETAEKLIFPGQKQSVQIALSALQHGDGVVLGNATGSGKTYLASGLIKEFQNENPNAKILYITKNAKLKRKTKAVAENSFGFNIDVEKPKDVAVTGVYAASYMGTMQDSIYKQMKWDLVVADESGEARNWFKPDNQQGKLLMEVIRNSKKAVYMSATPFHSPSEYGYLEKLNLWPKGQFDKWIADNFAHETVDGKIVARLDPGKQAKLRQQLIERGQFVSQAISYDGFSAHFGVVPVTDQMKRGLDRIREGFARARSEFLKMGKKGLAEKVSAFEATYTKAFLERERLPQAIELAKKARGEGWQVILFSEHSADDLFRRERDEEEEASTYQQLDDAMGGQLSKIIPPFPNVYNKLREEFGAQIGDYSGRGNTQAERDKAVNEFLAGQTPMLYTTYAAGGIGVDMHDADFPDMGIKGGDKPRISLFLGPPYSGVLLEQAMGRAWRFGVKSNTISVFLATDSEPDVRLMTTKVGPRMRALRAAVLGEKDSLASAMDAYTDEQKLRERQDALAYAEGNEVKVTANDFNVRSKKRDVGVQEWSAITFPPAETAKNKGMKYGEEVPGGDWSTLFQAKYAMYEPPTPSASRAMDTIDAIGNGVSTGVGVPEGTPVRNLDPADRDVVVSGASAAASGEAGIGVERDAEAAARQSMQSQLNMPGDRNKWVLTFPRGKGKGSKLGVWKYTGDPEDLKTTGEPGPEAPKNVRTWYLANIYSQEVGIRSMARQAGTPEIGDNIVRMNRAYQADYDTGTSQYRLLAADIMADNHLDPHDAKVMSELWDVVEGKWSTGNPRIAKAASDLSDLMGIVHGDLGRADVKTKTPTGEFISFKDQKKDATYMPHRIDWEAQVEDPLTGEKHTLKEVMGKTFAEDKRARIIQSLSEATGEHPNTIVDYLNQHKPGTPVLSHVHRARTINFPIIKKDWATLLGYFDQAAEAVAIEKHFGSDRKKINEQIEKIPSANGRNWINSMFDAMLEPQDWKAWEAKFYNAMVSFEAASKMTLSAAKVPFHLVHAPMSLGGRMVPIAKALGRMAIHPREVIENATFAGTLARHLSIVDIVAAKGQNTFVHEVFKKFLFESFYKYGRAIAGESARIWMEQYAMNDLRKGGKAGEEARRLVKDTMLVGDQAIDDALANGRWAPEDLARAQTGFANLTMFSDNSLQMPGLARLNTTETTPYNMFKRALRLTYALQSFSLKTTSLLREKLYDEVVHHGNLKPLAYFLMVYPIAGEMLRATGAGVKAGVQLGTSGIAKQFGGGQKKEDSWEKYLDSLQEIHKHPVIGLLKRYIDNLTFSIAWDRTRRLADPLLEMAEGGKDMKKKARTSLQYFKEDEVEQDIGAAWNSLVWEPISLGIREAKIATGSTGTDHDRHEKEGKTLLKFMLDEFPITKSDPQLQDWLKEQKHKSGGGVRF